MTDKSKSAQITIFVVVAILIVLAIILLFILYQTDIIKIPRKGVEPPDYVAKCVKDFSNEAIEIMLEQGGYIEPTNYKLYNDQKIGYICYTSNNYIPCVMQEPVYIGFLENEITNYITPYIENCFISLKNQLEKENYIVDMGPMSLSTELMQDKIQIRLKRELTIRKNEETKRYYNFDKSIRDVLYNLAIVAQEIASQEAKYCNFEYVGFMMLYPEFDIDKKSVGYDVKIYSVADRKTGDKLTFAIRSCVIPPGLG